MELWTTEDAAKYWGVSTSRARAILAAAGVRRINGYDAEEVRNIHRPGQGARTDLKESSMTTTTQLLGFGSYTTSARVEDYVAGYLGEFADDYDFEGLVAAYREAVNGRLADTGISLHGDDFYSTYPAPEDSADLIKAAIENADLGELAQDYDKS